MVVHTELPRPRSRCPKRVCEKLRAKADRKTRQTAPHGIAELTAYVERDVVDTEASAEHDRAVELVEARLTLVRLEHVVLDAGGVGGTGERAKSRLRLALEDSWPATSRTCDLGKTRGDVAEATTRTIRGSRRSFAATVFRQPGR